MSHLSDDPDDLFNLFTRSTTHMRRPADTSSFAALSDAIHNFKRPEVPTKPVSAACAARVQLEQSGSWIDAIAIMPTAGISDVQYFVLCDRGTIVPSVWNYELYPYAGCFTVHF